MRQGVGRGEGSGLPECRVKPRRAATPIKKKNNKTPSANYYPRKPVQPAGGRKKKSRLAETYWMADGGGARANMTPVGEEIKGKGSAVSSPSDEQ